jgi:MFS family permease
MPDESKMQAEVKRVAAKLRANSKPHHKAGTSQAESKKGMADEERRILAFADRVALAGIAIGLFGAIAALSFPLAYPDLIPVHSWRVVLLISLCILAIAIGFLIYEIVREIGTGRDKRTRKRLLIGLLVGSVIFGIVTWCLWPQDEMDKRLPGFGGYAVLRLFDDPDFRRKYVFNDTPPAP